MTQPDGDRDEFDGKTPDEVAADDAAEALNTPTLPRMVVTGADTYTPPPTFTREQEARAEALRVSRDVMLARGSVFGGSKVELAVSDVVDLAVYIVDGTHPLDRYDEPVPDPVIELPVYGDEDDS